MQIVSIRGFSSVTEDLGSSSVSYWRTFSDQNILWINWIVSATTANSSVKPSILYTIDVAMSVYIIYNYAIEKKASKTSVV